MTAVAKGNAERLPSGSWRVVVYAGVDPLTGKEIYRKATGKTAHAAQLKLARLFRARGDRPRT